MPAAETLAKDAAKTADKTAEKLKINADQSSDAGAKAFKDGMEKSLAGLNALNAQSKATLDAFAASAAASAKGAETLGAQAMAYGKSAMEKHVEAAKAFSTARSLQDVMALQGAYAKSAMEAYLAEMNRASDVVSATFKDAVRPLNERANAAMQTLQTAR